MDVLDVHALGPSGAGKTVLMAGVYNRLHLRRADLTFYLRSDHRTSLDLNAVFNRVADPDGSWPEASQDIREWDFTVTVPTATDEVDALRVRYLDYPGGVLTNPNAAADSRIQELVDQLGRAHGLLVLLDGMAMRDILRDDPAGRRYLRTDLTSSLEIAQRSRCPIHFVVTKWDLLHGEFELAALRDRLLAEENIADLLAVKRHTVPATIRLIPVSSVGTGFAELMPDGRMRKTGRPARPEGVEIPLMAVLPDFMQFAHAELTRRESELDQPSPQGMDKWLAAAAAPGTTTKLGVVAARLLQRYGPSLGGKVLRNNPGLAALLVADPDGLAERITGFADRMIAARTERRRAGRDASIAALHQQRMQITTAREAFALLEQQFAGSLDDFEQRHPASVLVGGTAGLFTDPIGSMP